MSSVTPVPPVRSDPESRDEKAAALRRIMETEGAAVAENTRGFNEGRYETVGRLVNYEDLKRKARQIKERAIEQLPALIEQVREAVEARGGTVTVAENAAAANARIRELAQGARRVAKSKSMTTEEIEVNEHLEAAGLDVVETDLAEWVLQLADEPASHLVVPAMHKSREEIARLVNEHFDLGEPLETPEELTGFARRTLWRKIRTADVGMTGANFITADTGTLALVTSEGNAQKSVLMAPTYVAVAGIEKIVPRVEDLQPFVELIGRSGTGQDLTSYLSLFTPPFDTPVPDRDGSEPDGERPPEHRERSFHLVLLDNGRRAMRDDSQLKETLYCIRCGACANSCANFQEVGGHAFGGETYSGGIATGWEAGVHGLDSAASFNDLCTGCSRCVNACPVNIDIPWINVVVRDRVNRGRDGSLDWLVDGLTPEPDTEGASLRQRLFARFETLARLGSATAPLSNWVNGLGPVRAFLDWAVGIDRRRALPAFSPETLRQWAARRESTAPEGADRAVLYPDLYTNYVRVQRGKAAVRTLESLGLRVEIPDVPGSGRAPLSQGMIASARRKAEVVWEALEAPIAAGRDIVVIEPSDLAMFQRRYAKLLPETAARTLERQTYEITDYVQRQIEAGADADDLRRGQGQAVAYHSHCQQRTLDLEPPTVELLDALGYHVQTSSVECCGMAGSFGYKSEYYELSMKVGQQLRQEFAPEGREAPILAASGTSCMEQLEALFGRPVVHPLQVVAPDA